MRGPTLNETALQTARQCADMGYGTPEGRDRALILAYLKEAGFWVEVEDRRVEFGDAEPIMQRLLGPWVPVDQEKED